jgi:hypothetical protein
MITAVAGTSTVTAINLKRGTLWWITINRALRTRPIYSTA